MYYQLTYLVPSDIADFKELEKIISSINSRITETGGNLKESTSGTSGNQMSENSVSSEELKKIAERQKVSMFKHRLAYPIKRRRFGFYISNIFSIDGKNPAETLKKLDTALKADKDVIRFITVNFDFAGAAKQAEEKKKTKIRAEAAKTLPQAKEKETAQSAILNEESKKTKIEDLDKKLEQILNA